MNGANEIYTRLAEISRSAGNLKSSHGPVLRAASNETAKLPEFALLAAKERGISEKNDNVQISEQAKERLREYEVIKLETPPHITSVKEHIQELAKRLLQPGYERSNEQRELDEAYAALLAELVNPGLAGQSSAEAGAKDSGPPVGTIDTVAEARPEACTALKVNAAPAQARAGGADVEGTAGVPEKPSWPVP